MCITCESCQPLCRLWYNDIRIGQHIAYIEASDNDRSIQFCTSSPCCESGITLVPGTIVRYKFNDDWIIAQSTKDGYYIIDKSFDKERKPDIDSIGRFIYGPIVTGDFDSVRKGLHVDLNW